MKVETLEKAQALEKRISALEDQIDYLEIVEKPSQGKEEAPFDYKKVRIGIEIGHRNTQTALLSIGEQKQVGDIIYTCLLNQLKIAKAEFENL